MSHALSRALAFNATIPVAKTHGTERSRGAWPTAILFIADTPELVILKKKRLKMHSVFREKKIKLHDISPTEYRLKD